MRRAAVPTVGRGGAARVPAALNTAALGRFSTIRTKADMDARDPAAYSREQFTGGRPTCVPLTRREIRNASQGFRGAAARFHRPQAGRAWVQRDTQTNRPCFSFFRAWAPDTWGRGRWRHRRNNEVEKDKLAMTVRTPAPLLNSLSHTSDTVCRLSGACVWLRRGGFESLSHLTQSPTAPA